MTRAPLLACAWMLAFTNYAARAQPAPGSWHGLANTPSRIATTPHPIPSITAPTWTCSTDADGNTISFLGQAPTAVSATTVFAVGRVSPPGQPANQPRLFAIDRNDGHVRWWMPIAAIVLDSSSGPALDNRAGTVIVASQRLVTAFDQHTGAQRWQTTLTRSVVNASPLVVNEPARPGRVFITDYDGFGTAAELYCINAATPSPGNPHQPGEIIWAAPIGGGSGNTPAYLPWAEGGRGLVYCTTPGDGAGSGNPGKLLAFDAFAPTLPAPIFTFINPAPEGFFGGVAVIAPARNGVAPTLLAATYAFSGGLDAGNLAKVNGATGELLWSIPCNRTQSIPLPLPGGRIALSSGIRGFGSLPSLQLFMDHGPHASMLWDSAISTWFDADADGFIDPGEYTPIGGWTQQPVASTFAGRTTLAIGLIPDSGTFATPSNELLVLDLDAPPASPGFVHAQVNGCGGSPSVAGSSMLSIGAAGLVHYGPTPATLDLWPDSHHAVDDVYAWESGATPISRDIDRSGAVTPEDRALLVTNLRATESRAMTQGRP